VDLDGDGHRDILSGSWPGEIFLFRGTGDGSFAAPEMLRNKKRKIINIGGGIRTHPGFPGISIHGSAEYEHTDEGTFVIYQGKRLKSTEEEPISMSGTASTAHPVDWDDDGDYDIVVGDVRGNVFLLPNEGMPNVYAFGREKQLQAAGKKIEGLGAAGPCTADWDGDGDIDLLVGAGDGRVLLYRNCGTRKRPELAAAEELVPAGSSAYGADAPKDVRRGTRSKICVADWNGDGRLDLLVGDAATQKPSLPGITSKQRAEHARIREELAPLEARESELVGMVIGPRRTRMTKEDREKVGSELALLSERIRVLREKLPPEYERRGWVWLFLRE